MHSRRDLDRYLRTAVRACRSAGRLQLRSFGTVRKVEHKGEIDLVTDIDRESEDRIIDIITRDFPRHGYLAEERAPSGPGREFLWLVDPLDGTTNFSRGFPFFCISVALARQGTVLAGAIYVPVLGELFTATLAGGAFLNGRRIRVSSGASLGGSFLATGFPYDIRRSRRNNLDNFCRFATRTLAVRRAGAAALDLAYVADGRFDGFWELKLKPWDMAAGSLLVREAGGEVTTPSGRPWTPSSRDIVASNGRIHRQMLAILQGTPPRRGSAGKRGGTS